jgi:protein-tyrosine phosphatase
LRRPATSPDPAHGVYLFGRDPGPFAWSHDWIRWPDFRTPADTQDAIVQLRSAFERARTERVESVCGGGSGRTGTALADLATLAGVEPTEAVRWVRSNSHPRAVETPWQRRWVIRAAQLTHQ